MTQIALTPNTVYTFKMNSGEEMVAKVKQSVRMKYLEATTGIKVPEKKILVG